MDNTHSDATDNLERFSTAISTKAMEGYVVIDRNDKTLKAVLEKKSPGGEVNHLLHLILTLVTCGIWGIVWLVLALLNKKEKIQRIRISIDNQNNLIEETIKA